MSVEGEGCCFSEAGCGGAAAEAGEAADEEGGFCGAVGGLADVMLLLPSLVVLAPLEPPLAAPVADEEDSSVTEAWTTGISACRMAISHARATCKKNMST